MKKEEGKTKKEKVIKRNKSVFEILSTTDFSKKISELQVGGKKLSYLSWSEAWTEVMIISDKTFSSSVKKSLSFNGKSSPL
jgi:hypothetical protein